MSADVSAAQNGLSALGNQLDQTTKQFQAAAPAAALLGAAGAAVGVGLAGAVKVAADFEHQMSGVKAVMSPAEVEQFGTALDQLGIQLGRDTVFSSREAAAAIEELIKAGVPAQAVLEGAGAAALNLAAATGVTTTEAATIAAQAMNTFGKQAGDLTGVMDRLSAVANASSSDVSFLRFGLAAAGGVAAGVGLSFDDTAVALGLLSGSFATGSDAGTSFKAFLNGLIPDSKQQKAEFRALGLTTDTVANAFFDASGHIKSFEQITAILRRSLGGLNDVQRQQALTTIFGTDGQRAANAIFAIGEQKVRDFSAETGASGSVARSAQARMDNLEGTLKNLGGSFETVQIIVGRFFIPVLRTIAEAIRGPLDAFSSMSPAAQQAATALVALGGAIASGLGSMILLAPIIRALGPSFAALGSSLVRVAPFFLRISGLAGILFVAWQANLFGIRELVQRAFDAIPTILDRVGNAFARAGGLWENTILPAIQTIGNAVERTLIPVFNDVWPVVQDLWNRLAPILGNLGIVFQKVFSGDIGGALDTFRAIIIAALPGAAGFVDLVGRIADTVGRFAGNIGAGLLTFFTETLPPIVETIGQFAGDIGAGLLAFFNDTILPIAAAAASFAGDVGSGLTTFFTVTLPPILAQIGSFAGGIGDAMLAFFRDNLPVIASAASSFVGDIGSGLTTFFTVTLPPIVTAIASFTTDATAPLIQFFGEQIPSVIDALGKFSGDVGTGIFTFFTQTLPPIIASAGTVTQDTFSAVVDFFQNKAPIIIDGAAKFNASQGAQLSPLSAFFAQFDDIRTQVQSLEPLFGSISSFATSLDNLQQAVTNLLARSFGSLLKPEFELFSNTLKNFADAATPVQPTLDSIGTTVETLGQKLSGVTEFINNGAKAIQGLADSLNALPADKLPGAGTGTGGFGLNPDLFNGNANPSTPLFKQTAFNPNGSGAGGGPTLNFNAPVSINGAGDLSDFAQAIADAIDASSRRVSTPPDNSGFPPLATSFA